LRNAKFPPSLTLRKPLRCEDGCGIDAAGCIGEARLSSTGDRLRDRSRGGSTDRAALERAQAGSSGSQMRDYSFAGRGIRELRRERVKLMAFFIRLWLRERPLSQ